MTNYVKSKRARKTWATLPKDLQEHVLWCLRDKIHTSVIDSEPVSQRNALRLAIADLRAAARKPKRGGKPKRTNTKRGGK